MLNLVNAHGSLPSPEASVFRVATHNRHAGVVTLHFDGFYQVGQELLIMVGDEGFIYRVTEADVHADVTITRANVARGMLAALVNGGFTGFPCDQPTLFGNQLSLLPVQTADTPMIDGICARNLWCN
ncbi:MAG: hypothetical protein J0H69_01780 [Burkholderiales bacterium]|jgi:hypothetical protein|nr:hypothetical protein [Burkholderiales bacterium]